MHDLMIGIAFILMVASPAMVATIGGRKEYNPNPDVPSLPRVCDVKAQLAAPPVSPAAARPRPAIKKRPLLTYSDVTLPVHNARGMANR
jgi:hypothetical protein